MNSTVPSMDEARLLLQRHFGYADFRPGQDEIIRSVLEGRDTLAVMPTGGGKSLCYQVPALLCEGLTLVVSPLISLMQDQVEALQRAEVRATFINSMLDFREVQERIEKARHGWYRLMYVAPERFESASFAERIAGTRIALFAVDEAHCISEWGHDFRPSYMKLREARELLASPPVVALTATATPDVRSDIVRQLGMQNPRVIVRGFARDNLTFRVAHGSAKRETIFRHVSSGCCGIVYAGTRNTVEELAGFLRQHAIRAEAYHAGLDDVRRREVQERFMSGDTRVMVATTAFGMGIDKSDVRVVIHHDMPGSIEQYYQEAGRAGRDGEESICLLLHAQGDRSLPEFFIRQTFPDRGTVQNVYAALFNYTGTEVGHRFRGLLPLTHQSVAAQMGGKTSESSVRSALDLLERSGYIRRISASWPQSRVQFLLSAESIRSWLLDAAPPTLSPVMVALLRTAGGEAFYHAVDIEIAHVAEKTFLADDALLAGLRALHELGIISFHAGQRASGIALLGERVSVRDLDIDYHQVQQRMAHQMEKLQAMEHYILGKACRRNMILEYFEESDIHGTCGKCDTCSAPQVELIDDDGESDFEEYSALALHCTAELGGRFGRMTLVDVLRGSKSKRIAQYRLYAAATYGKASRCDRQALIAVFDTLTGLGWLEKTEGAYPALRITDLGRRKLGRDVDVLPVPRRSDVDEADVADPILYEALRGVRRRVAGALNLPSHSLVSDEVLRRIVRELPRDEDAMLAVEGVGPVFFRKCGKAMLEAVSSHVEQMDLASAMEASRGSVAQLPQNLRLTFELCVQGLSLGDIAERRGLTEGTVSGHIADLIGRGVRLDVDRLVAPERQDAIRRAAAALKKADVKRIKAVLEEDVSYAEIRVMLAVMKGRGT